MKTITLLFLTALCIALPAQSASRGRLEIGSRVQKARIATYSDTTCAALDGGGVRCWGANENEQIGNGTVSPSVVTPVAPSAINLVVAIAGGDKHACALLATGVVKCWGDNGYGQLGGGTTVFSSSTAIQVIGIEKAIAITAGARHTCAILADGTGRCWGYNGFGSLGNGATATTTNRAAAPVTVLGLVNAVSISAGEFHTCALIANATVRCWGHNLNGQLGDSSNTQRSLPVTIVGLTALEIGTGRAHSCALRTDGTARCWGRNVSAQLGDGTTTDRNSPVAVSQLDQAVAIDGGSEHTCAIRADGTIRCWGRADNGQLGDGATLIRRFVADTPVAGINTAVEIAAGATHTCAMDANGTARCWGANNLGQLGNGTTSSSSTPTTATGVVGGVGARGIAASFTNTCARRGNGAVVCWGSNAEGQLGTGVSGADSLTPAAQGSSPPAIALTAGSDYFCALRSSGTVACWGRNLAGQLGNGNTNNRSSQTEVPGLTGVVSVSAGHIHTCAVLYDASVRCWGSNQFGKLGNNSAIDSLTPTAVVGLPNSVAVAAGTSHTCALLVGGTVRCWGRNDQGQLGNGTNTDSLAPVIVTGLSNAVAIAARGDNTCALLGNGNLRCWGDNQHGQLGNSTLQDRNIPDVVSGIVDAVSVFVSYRHACAVRATGSADCWGDNADGRLGAADPADYTTPTGVIDKFASVQGLQIPIRLQSILAVAAGGNGFIGHTCALQATGLPRCWGDNVRGQLGNGTAIENHRPQLVSSFTANVLPAGTITKHSRIAELTALVNCDPGGQAHVYVNLLQGSVTGAGVTNLKCGYGMLQEPMKVPAHGRDGFQPGAATANLELIVRNKGEIVEHQFWTREVVLTLSQ